MIRSNTFLLAVCAIASLANAQTLERQVIATAGSSFTVGSLTVSTTLGEPFTATLSNGNHILTQGFQQGEPVRVKLNIRALLQGPFNSGTGLMDDGLRTNGLVPLGEPYTALGFVQVGGGDETINASVLTTTGNDAIVDWIYVQLRDKNDNTLVLATRCALVQRDGDVVDVDGTSPVSFAASADNYYLTVFHRNHLGVMTLAPVALSSTAAAIDLTNGSVPAYGTEAQADIGGTRTLWCGDVTNDGLVKYAGANNDRDPVLAEVGGNVPTAVSNGYLNADVNMDGQVKYAGSNNDRDRILQVVGGSVPTAVRVEQMP
ncbi:MAG: hypothetical protein H6595_06695 [Flavobacteriales bacterium]|nr:hypothetical protein [Flavobacteriales bacterium]MCB9167154.1 hypothetical protein [Flavobacteriales bacterium]